MIFLFSALVATSSDQWSKIILSIFGRGHYGEHSCEIIFILDQMLFKDISIFSSGGHFIQQRGTICAILVEVNMRTISVVHLPGNVVSRLKQNHFVHFW